MMSFSSFRLGLGLGMRGRRYVCNLHHHYIPTTGCTACNEGG